MDIFFLADVALNARTAYVDKHTHVLVVEPRRILRHYVATWFWLDCASSIP